MVCHSTAARVHSVSKQATNHEKHLMSLDTADRPLDHPRSFGGGTTRLCKSSSPRSEVGRAWPASLGALSCRASMPVAKIDVDVVWASFIFVAGETPIMVGSCCPSCLKTSLTGSVGSNLKTASFEDVLLGSLSRFDGSLPWFFASVTAPLYL